MFFRNPFAFSKIFKFHVFQAKRHERLSGSQPQVLKWYHNIIIGGKDGVCGYI